jgi:hypothetical protein
MAGGEGIQDGSVSKSTRSYDLRRRFAVAVRFEEAVNYPTLEEVESADRHQICGWWRFLKSPGDDALDAPNYSEIRDNQIKIMAAIGGKFREMGGFTPEISKSWGWGER